MKNLRFIFCFLLGSMAIESYAQQVVVDSPEYHRKKASGTLEEMQVIPAQGGNFTLVNPYTGNSSDDFISKSNDCNCYRDPDGTYTLALSAGDDGSSGQITIPFQFSFYGTNYNKLYINNNGNITFGNSLSAYSSSAFPSAPNKIIAPFWADVDTRGGNGRVVYKITNTAIFVNWENVGYYDTKGDKRNSFQLILTNGADPSVPGGGNVAFCYKDMQWTTGGASSGQNGFGGIPATAGANKGDNATYFQLARFDHAGTDFHGALGAPAGISWLDNKSFFFNITNSNNIPPIANGVTACDTFKICALGDTADFPVIFLSPEVNQTTTITVDVGGSGAVTELANIPGNTATVVIRAIGTLAEVGYHTVTLTARDNGSPVGVTTLTFTVWISDEMVVLEPEITPNGGCQNANLTVLNGPYDSYLWDDYTSTPNYNATASGNYGVTVSKNGCWRRVTKDITIMPPIVANIQGSFGLCPNEPTSFLYIPDSTKYSSVSWGLTAPDRDTMFSNHLPAGTYTVHLVDSLGYCQKDTTFRINSQPTLVGEPDRDQCTLTYQFTNNTGGSGQATWTAFNSPGQPTFSNETNNPLVTFPTYGVYNLVIQDKYCPQKDTIRINVVRPPDFDFDSDFFVCPFEKEHLVFKDSALIRKFHWGLPIPSLDTLFSANLYQGTYTASYEMFLGCTRDTTFTIASPPPTQFHQYGEVCGDFLNMTLHAGTPTGHWTVQTMPQGAVAPVFGNADSLNTSIRVTNYGDYEFAFANQCGTSVLKLKFIPYPSFSISDATICMGDEYIFEVPQDPFVQTYQWNTGATTSTLKATEEGWYILTATNQCGVLKDTAYLTVDICELDFPNVFTPNGDGSNDVFTSIQHPSGFATFECVIFNRWGNIMYTYDDINGQWDGKVGGTMAAEGIYFYKVKAVTKTGKEVDKQGFFHLLLK